MKIGILTYYGDLNCGTNLQAFATLSAVKDIFPDSRVEIIDFHGFRQDIKPYLFQANLKTILNDIVRISKYRSFVKEELGVKKERIIKNVDDALRYIKKKKYDRIYVGADTLLELDRLPRSYDGLSAYWLSPEITGKKYLLSASSKNVNYSKLSDYQKKLMEETLNSFSGFAVRDDATFSLLSNFIPKEKLIIVPDPTFTLNINYSYIKAYLSRHNYNIGHNTICIHHLKDDGWVLDFAKLLRQNNYKIASLRPAKWADFIFNDLSPFEQLGLYKSFKCVITHRFHDTVFCLKNNTPVICYPPSLSYADNGESKYSSLMKLFSLENDCLIKDRQTIRPNELYQKMQKTIEVYNSKLDTINEKLNTQRASYLNFLRSTL